MIKMGFKGELIGFECIWEKDNEWEEGKLINNG